MLVAHGSLTKSVSEESYEEAYRHIAERVYDETDATDESAFSWRTADAQ